MQAIEKPKCDNMFMTPGMFPADRELFEALGKWIQDSGGPAMLSETDVLPTGSLNDFRGKHFYRCERLHPILELLFEILHFQASLETYDEKEELT